MSTTTIDPPSNPAPLLYTVPEAAKQLRIGRSSLYELIATDQIASITIGSRRLIAHDDLVTFIHRRKSDA